GFNRGSSMSLLYQAGANLSGVMQRFQIGRSNEVEEDSGNFTAILRFPSEKTAIAMYNSQEYAPLKAKRLELTNGGNVIFVPGIQKTLVEGSAGD
ncbi:MAG: DUF1330 domain-containing protein, partial [Thiobacillus sp.]